MSILKSTRMRLFYLIFLTIVVATAIIHRPQEEQRPNDTQPQLSVDALFAASDVQLGLKQAYVDQDDEVFVYWQNILLEAALEVGYDADQVRFLAGERGLDYVKFRAARMLFQEAIDAAYINGEAFEPIAAQYPQAEDLFADAQAMFRARNEALNGIASALMQSAQEDPSLGTLTPQQAQQHALALWQQKLQSAARAPK